MRKRRRGKKRGMLKKRGGKDRDEERKSRGGKRVNMKRRGGKRL